MIYRFVLIAVLLLQAVAPRTQAEAPELVIRRSATVQINGEPGVSYMLEGSTNFAAWEPIQTDFVSPGVTTSTLLTDTNGYSFFRLKTEEYPTLGNFEIVSGARNMNPAFAPKTFHYAFRYNNDVTKIKPTFDPAKIASCTINGVAVANGGTFQFSGSNFKGTETNSVDIFLVGTNGLKTKYVFRVLPPNFPNVSITNSAAAPRDYAILTTLRINSVLTYLAILDPNGVPYWWRTANVGLNFTLQPNGLLTFSENTTMNEKGEQLSHTVIFDQNLNPMMYVEPIGELSENHCFRLTSRGTAMLVGFTNVVRDLTDLTGEKDVPVSDHTVQEISLADKQVVYEWNSWGHISYVDSYFPRKNDYSHINWMQEQPDGNFIVSSRGMSQILKINREDGNVLWRLGRNGDFEFVNDPRNGFGGQHYSHFLPNGHLLLYDNRNLVSTNVTLPEDGPSRAVEYALDYENKTATLVWSYQREGYHTSSQGGAQRLENGNTFISWGRGTPGLFTEVDPAGNIVCDGRALTDAGEPTDNYLCYKIKRNQVPGILARDTSGPQPK